MVNIVLLGKTEVGVSAVRASSRDMIAKAKYRFGMALVLCAYLCICDFCCSVCVT